MKPPSARPSSRSGSSRRPTPNGSGSSRRGSALATGSIPNGWPRTAWSPSGPGAKLISPVPVRASERRPVSSAAAPRAPVPAPCSAGSPVPRSASDTAPGRRSADDRCYSGASTNTCRWRGRARGRVGSLPTLPTQQYHDRVPKAGREQARVRGWRRWSGRSPWRGRYSACVGVIGAAARAWSWRQWRPDTVSRTTALNERRVSPVSTRHVLSRFPRNLSRAVRGDRIADWPANHDQLTLMPPTVHHVAWWPATGRGVRSCR